MVKTYIGILAISLLTTIGTSVFADDIKILPGSACDIQKDQRGLPAVGPSSEHDHSTEGLEKAEFIKNITNKQLWVTCPVIRDKSYDSSGRVYAYVYVKRGPKGEINCALESFSTYGVLVGTDNSWTFPGRPNYLPLYINASHSLQGYYNLTCMLPPQSILYGYMVKEVGLTDSNN